MIAQDATVILVGTCHEIQLGKAHAPAFRTFLKSLAEASQVDSISEEMSEDGLKCGGASESVAQGVARELSVRYQPSDPTSEERKRLGMEDRDALEPMIRMVIGGQPSPETVRKHAEAVRVADEQREQYWLEQIRLLRASRILFVCGAHHVTTFASALRANGFEVVIAASDWPGSTAMDGKASG